MIQWFLQFGDLLNHRIVHVFFVFGAFCWTVWLIRAGAAVRYRPFRGDTPDLAVSVLVPTYNEALEDLRANLREILRHMRPDDELLLLVDERDPNKSAVPSDDPRVKIFTTPKGKRQALKVGIANATKPIYLLTGSDTRFTSSTVEEILKPFADPSVGGVTGKVIAARRFGVGAWCYRWSLHLRNMMVYPGMSASKTVHVLNGECYAARTQVAQRVLGDFTSQTYLGRTCDSGDDGWMTTLLLREGYRTLYQSTAVAETEPPIGLREFMRQQLRWHRNSMRRSLTAVGQGWAWRRSALYPFHLITALVKTPAWIAIMALAVVSLFVATGPEVETAKWLEPLWSDWRLAFFVLGIILVRAIRGLPYLVSDPRAVLFLPVYAFLAPFVFAPLRMYGMATAHKVGWVTRTSAPPALPQHKPARLISTAMTPLCVIAITGFLVFVVFPPLAFALAVIGDDEFDAY